MLSLSCLWDIWVASTEVISSLTSTPVHPLLPVPLSPFTRPHQTASGRPLCLLVSTFHSKLPFAAGVIFPEHDPCYHVCMSCSTCCYMVTSHTSLGHMSHSTPYTQSHHILWTQHLPHSTHYHITCYHILHITCCHTITFHAFIHHTTPQSTHHHTFISHMKTNHSTTLKTLPILLY